MVWFFICGLQLILILIGIFMNGYQADPTDPEAFPFVLLGNKIDVDGGSSRAV